MDLVALCLWPLVGIVLILGALLVFAGLYALRATDQRKRAVAERDTARQQRDRAMARVVDLIHRGMDADDLVDPASREEAEVTELRTAYPDLAEYGPWDAQ